MAGDAPSRNTNSGSTKRRKACANPSSARPATALVGSRDNSAPITAPIWATSLVSGPRRPILASNEPCKVAGSDELKIAQNNDGP